jgi:hypothetical protein
MAWRHMPVKRGALLAPVKVMPGYERSRQREVKSEDPGGHLTRSHPGEGRKAARRLAAAAGVQ